MAGRPARGTAAAGGHGPFEPAPPPDATCAGAPAYTQTVTVSGNGTYSTSNATFIASTEGTWRWASAYTGDDNNEAATSPCGTERFTIANN